MATAPAVTVTAASPTPRPVRRPVAATVTTVGSVDSNVTLGLVSTRDWASRTVTLSWRVAPRGISATAGVTSTEAGAAGPSADEHADTRLAQVRTIAAVFTARRAPPARAIGRWAVPAPALRSAAGRAGARRAR